MFTFLKRGSIKGKLRYKSLFFATPPVLLLLAAAALRFINLGYSDFQGDEIKAFFAPVSGQSLSEYLLTQRKGPMQFLVTYLLSFLDPTYVNQFLMRLPFTVAGFLAVYFFYKFVKIHFGKKVAFYSAFFLATNGFYVAFSRLVQYQSLVILFMVLTLYVLSLAATAEKWKYKGLYLGSLFWALSILSHYDGVFIAPFVAYLYLAWARNNLLSFKSLSLKFSTIKNLKHLIYAGLVLIALVLAFYIPFYFNIDQATKDYWRNRVVNDSAKLSSSHYLFSVYQPIYVVHIYTVLSIFGILYLFKALIPVGLLTQMLKKRFAFLSVLPFGKTLLFGSLSLALFTGSFVRNSALFLWFFAPFVFMEVFVGVPGTHIYTYLAPAFILLGLGILHLEQLSRILLKNLGPRLVYAGTLVVFLFIFLQSFAVFVDNYQEYPWEDEKFFVWTFPRPTPVFHLSLFGFPYYRAWEDVGQYIRESQPTIPCPNNKEMEECPFKLSKNEHYTTNERDTISRWHIAYPKEKEKSGFYVRAIHPQSFTKETSGEKLAYWTRNYTPAGTFYRCKGDWLQRLGIGLHHDERCKGTLVEVTHVYYMPIEPLDQLVEFGF